MKQLFYSNFYIFIILICANDALAETAIPDEPPIQLEKVWVAEGFTEPEGVAVDGEILYISNMVGADASQKDGAGWISKLSLNGELITEKWVDGLHAPKGMAVHQGKLYVSDVDAFHIIDIATAQIQHTYPVDGAQFLNDITVWQDEVYMSDSRTARIFRIDANGYSEWLTDPQLTGVNGLTADGNRLLIAAMESGALLETTDGVALKTLATGMKNGDGIAVLDNGGYLVSSWPGQIWYASTQGEVTKLFDTEAAPMSQNDLTRVGDLIIVPSKVPNIVTAWRVVD
ncbi:MAG: hypothetical protein AAGA72_18095 [Pseudomonadota bacterium]